MEKGKQVTLTIGEDMTHSKFVSWLNKKFTKPSREPFNAQDVYGYVQRGNIPYQYGTYKLIETNHREIGVKIITVTELNTSK